MQGVPLYRQELSFMKEGIKLSRQTMANWLLRAGKEWLYPLYNEMRRKLLEEEIHSMRMKQRYRYCVNPEGLHVPNPTCGCTVPENTPLTPSSYFNTRRPVQAHTP
ncbi:IS66 family transposase [Cloacibacillus porcorum]